MKTFDFETLCLIPASIFMLAPFVILPLTVMGIVKQSNTLAILCESSFSLGLLLMLTPMIKDIIKYPTK